MRNFTEKNAPTSHNFSQRLLKLLSPHFDMGYLTICSNLLLRCILTVSCPYSTELCRTLFKQIVNNEFHNLHYLLPAKRDTQPISRLQFIQHFVRGQNNLKIRSYLTCLTTSDSRDILLLIVWPCVFV